LRSQKRRVRKRNVANKMLVGEDLVPESVGLGGQKRRWALDVRICEMRLMAGRAFKRS
jgi:hypothetical protein